MICQLYIKNTYWCANVFRNGDGIKMYICDRETLIHLYTAYVYVTNKYLHTDLYRIKKANGMRGVTDLILHIISEAKENGRYKEVLNLRFDFDLWNKK